MPEVLCSIYSTISKQTWWGLPVVPVLGRQKWEYHCKLQVAWSTYQVSGQPGLHKMLQATQAYVGSVSEKIHKIYKILKAGI